VQSYGWTDDDWLSRLGFAPERTIALRNPSTQQSRLLRTTLLPNMLALVGRNRTHRDQFRLFEIGQVYELADDGGSNETARLAGVSFQQADQPSLEEHFRAIKGVIEDLGRTVGRSRFGFEPSSGGEAPWQTGDHWVAIRQGEQTVGALGVLAGPILEVVSPEGGQVVWFEVAVDQLEGPIYPQVKYEPSPVYPGSWQDFSMIWDVGRGFAALEQRLAGFAHPLVLRRDFLYAYKGKGLPKGKASYSYRFWLGARDHTLESEEIDAFRSTLLGFLKTEEIPLRG